jgi:hypothetical protein
MKERILYFCVILAVTLPMSRGEAVKASGASTQERVLIDGLGVSFQPITGWHLVGPQAMKKNLGKYDFDKEELRRILASSSGSRKILSQMRDDPRTVGGIIPTLNVIANPASDTSKEAVKAATESLIVLFRRSAQQLEVVEPLSEVVISGKTVYSFTLEFSLPRDGVATPRIRTKTYVVPCKGVMLQFSMTEALPSEENARFVKFVESIEVAE